MIIAPAGSDFVLTAEGLPTDQYRVFFQQLAELDKLSGTGTPEGVIEALPGRFYWDTNGTAGSILYIKRDAHVGGDKTKGWVSV